MILSEDVSNDFFFFFKIDRIDPAHPEMEPIVIKQNGHKPPFLNKLKVANEWPYHLRILIVHKPRINYFL